MRARIKSVQRILALKILTAPGVGGEIVHPITVLLSGLALQKCLLLQLF